jgi:hypothetical protein
MSDFVDSQPKLKWCAAAAVRSAHQQALIGWYDSGSAELFCGQRVPDNYQVVLQLGRTKPALHGCDISLHRI